MTSRLYSIYDRVSLTYGPPTVEVSDATAIRVFKSILSNPQAGLMYQYPEDYDLYFIGLLDTEDGSLTPYQPHLVFKGGSCFDRTKSVFSVRSADQD